MVAGVGWTRTLRFTRINDVTGLCSSAIAHRVLAGRQRRACAGADERGRGGEDALRGPHRSEQSVRDGEVLQGRVVAWRQADHRCGSARGGEWRAGADLTHGFSVPDPDWI